MKLKYYMGTTNGINTCLVAGVTKKAIIQTAGISRYFFDTYWHETGKPEGFDIKPNTLYIGSGRLGERQTWKELRG